MKVYISGKIGEEVISDATRQKFARAQEMLLSKGHEVVNPVSVSYQEIMNMRIADVKLEWKEKGYDTKCETYDLILLFDIHAISECDAIYFLEDWDKSPGAGTEHSFAMATGKKLLWQRLEDAQVFRNENENAEDVWLPIEK